MSDLMLWMHPLLQVIVLGLAVYVLQMGYCRFCFLHLKKKKFFNWKRHVFLGKVVVWAWLAGLVIGLYAAHDAWATVGLTGPHYGAGLATLPLLLVSLVTGSILQKPKGQRLRLAAFHGTANILLFALVLYLTWTGIESVQLLLLE